MPYLNFAEYVALASFTLGLRCRRSFTSSLPSSPTAAALRIEIVGRCECFYTFWNTSFARLFEITSFRNVISDLQTRSQYLLPKCFSASLNQRPSASEETAQNTPQSMSSLHATALKYWHTATALFQIIIFVGEPTRIAAKLSFHCKRYGILQCLK